MQEIQLGLEAETSEIVTLESTAASHDKDLVAAYSTPALVGLMENAAHRAIQPHLPTGQTSVGIEIHVKHLAATPVGGHVRARAVVTKIEGSMIHLQLEAWDDTEKIGEGSHVRFVIDQERFYKRFEQKRAKMNL